MNTVHRWLRDVYDEIGIVEPILQGREDRIRIASPAIDGIYVLGKGFMNFDNSPYGFICSEIRKEHPNTKWEIANVDRGSLLSLFLRLVSATSNIDGAWFDPVPYLRRFKVDDVNVGV